MEAGFFLFFSFRLRVFGLGTMVVTIRSALSTDNRWLALVVSETVRKVALAGNWAAE